MAYFHTRVESGFGRAGAAVWCSCVPLGAKPRINPQFPQHQCSCWCLLILFSPWNPYQRGDFSLFQCCCCQGWPDGPSGVPEWHLWERSPQQLALSEQGVWQQHKSHSWGSSWKWKSFNWQCFQQHRLQGVSDKGNIPRDFRKQSPIQLVIFSLGFHFLGFA